MAHTPLFQISLAQWSLHRMIETGELDALDFPQFTKKTFGIDAVEYVNRSFGERAENIHTWKELRRRCDDLGVRSLLIMIDKQGDLGHPDATERHAAVENHHKWIEFAQLLGCHSIRVNAKSQGTAEEQKKFATDGLRKLSEFAEQYDINVLVENHGGNSSRGQWLSAVIRAVDHPNCGTLPDFGNFFIGTNWFDETQQKDPACWYDRYQGVRELMPFARAVSAKSNVFDKTGNEAETDYMRMMQIVLDAGYHGYVGIEYEGTTLSEVDGVRATKQLLDRVRDALTPQPV